MASTKPSTSFPSTQTQQPTPPTSRPASQAPPSRPASRPASQAGPTGLRYPSNRKTIYDRNLNRTRTAELSRASFAYLFAEMVSYAQKRVTGIQDLERRYTPPSLPAIPLMPSTLKLNPPAADHTPTDSPTKATPSASASSRCSCTAPQPSPHPPRPHNPAPRASSLSCNSSPARCGRTSLRAPPTPSKRALRTPRST